MKTTSRRVAAAACDQIWTVRKNHVMWSCALRFLSESYGWQVLIYRDADLTISHRFMLREEALRWAEHEQSDILKM